MTKEIKPSSMSMGILEILKEAFKIPSRNGKLALSLALLLLIPSSLLYLANDFALMPFLKDLFTKVCLLKKTDPESPEYAELLARIGKDIRIIAGEELIFMIAYCILGLFSTVATVYASAMTYSEVAENHPSSEDSGDDTVQKPFGNLRYNWSPRIKDQKGATALVEP
ncbi:uncharacterized protein LOC143879640 [Tasmannia lanceolata]|uniref:uncharacterized protein LOC143879640 n=1 Tax=Tasmannia lanceolata TaxID=3420 RepID=UPI0040632602